MPFISSADENSSPILGFSGEKEGPYDYGAPSYWYNDTSGGDGGASTGFDSESSPGDTIPTLDSLTPLPVGRRSRDARHVHDRRAHRPADPGHLLLLDQPVPHELGVDVPDGDNYNFGTMNNFDIALYNRYGSWLPSSGAPTATGNTTAGSAIVTEPGRHRRRPVPDRHGDLG